MNEKDQCKVGSCHPWPHATTYMQVVQRGGANLTKLHIWLFPVNCRLATPQGAARCWKLRGCLISWVMMTWPFGLTWWRSRGPRAWLRPTWTIVMMRKKAKLSRRVRRKWIHLTWILTDSDWLKRSVNCVCSNLPSHWFVGLYPENCLHL